MADPAEADGNKAFEAKTNFEHKGTEHVVGRSYPVTTDNQDVVAKWAKDGKIEFNA